MTTLDAIRRDHLADLRDELTALPDAELMLIAERGGREYERRMAVRVLHDRICDAEVVA